MTITDPSGLVTALLEVPGVAAAAVEPDPDGPGTLRLQLALGADEVDVAGAVNRLLRSRFGLAVDAERARVVGTVPSETDPAITIEALTPEATAPVEAPGSSSDGAVDDTASGRGDRALERVEGEPDGEARGDEVAAETAVAGRLVIERIQVVTARLGITVSITLRAGDRTGTGEYEGVGTSAALYRSVAAATLRAVEAVLDQQLRFDVEHVEIAATGQERTALVVVSLVTDRVVERLSGASVVRDDARQAVIRAVLAAVNRRVELLLLHRG